MAFTIQFQIGQTQYPKDGPVAIGQGGLFMQNQEIENEAVVLNVTTGDVIDLITPAERIPNPGVPTYGRYKVKHSPAVSEGDRILLSVDGVPKALYVIKRFVFDFVPGGLVTWEARVEKVL